jgi:hypothetical protein
MSALRKEATLMSAHDSWLLEGSEGFGGEEEPELGPDSGYLRKLIEAINRADEEEAGEVKS